MQSVSFLISRRRFPISSIKSFLRKSKITCSGSNCQMDPQYVKLKKYRSKAWGGYCKEGFLQGLPAPGVLLSFLWCIMTDGLFKKLNYEIFHTQSYTACNSSMVAQDSTKNNQSGDGACTSTHFQGHHMGYKDHVNCGAENSLM